MGVLSAVSPNKNESKSMEESAKEAEALESGSLPAEPEQDDSDRAHLTGAAKLLAEWPELVFRVLVLMVLGASLGALIAIMLRLILPQLAGSETEKAHLHMATTNLTAHRACALEALASKHHDRLVNLVLLHQHPAHTIQTVYLLSNKYPNLRTHFHEDPEEFFESSPLDGLTRMGGAGELLELAARTLSLWRHGGTSVDLDRPVLELPGPGEFVQRGSGSLLQFPQPCHPALQGLLASLGEDVRSSATETIARATKWICHLPSLEGATDEHFLPEKCLGVNILKDMTETPENLQCPIVRSLHHTIVQNGLPIMQIAVDLTKNVAQEMDLQTEEASFDSSSTTGEVDETKEGITKESEDVKNTKK